ncbi:hypothetical protein PG997_013710 [Apiospora hydei]|uniref:Uncharacterized protein n=1 Tax=Apiospora hydei TaxID=1337664 RepID=A0ABR1VAI3_9PEZI
MRSWTPARPNTAASTPRTSTGTSATPTPTPTTPPAAGGGGGSSSSEELPESRERRIWELRLLHNDLTMGHPFNVSQPPEMNQIFRIDVPNMALRDGWDVLLYGIMAHSALHMWTRATTTQERDRLVILQQTYKSLMLREQAREVVNLTLHNADALCFSSLKILAHALALVQTLPMDPRQPPVEWLRMGKGAGAVFKAAAELVDQGNIDAKIMTFLKHPPVMIDRSTTTGSDHSALDWLLEHPGPTPSMIQGVRRGAGVHVQRGAGDRGGESEDSVGRRLGGFAVLVPTDFTQFLIERRPRAMVVLAHFMSLWLDYEHVWIIGKAGERQIRGIRNSLPPAWRGKLDGLVGRLKGKGKEGRAGGVHCRIWIWIWGGGLRGGRRDTHGNRTREGCGRGEAC